MTNGIGAVMVCLNPTCSQPKAEDSLCCEACNTLRETTDADVCERCNGWAEHSRYDHTDTYSQLCDECYESLECS